MTPVKLKSADVEQNAIMPQLVLSKKLSLANPEIQRLFAVPEKNPKNVFQRMNQTT